MEQKYRRSDVEKKKTDLKLDLNNLVGSSTCMQASVSGTVNSQCIDDVKWGGGLGQEVKTPCA